MTTERCWILTHMHNLKDWLKNVNVTRKQMPINMRVDNLKEDEAVNMRLSPATSQMSHILQK